MTTLTPDLDNLPTGSVTISGTATQGRTLTASNTLADADGLGDITYTWKAAGTVFGTGTSIVLAEAQVGKAITVAASYTDAKGTIESVSSAATSTVANINDPLTGTLAINGIATQGQTLTAVQTLADADGIPALGAAGAIAYQWYANGTAIADAIDSTLVLGQAQVGQAITVKVSYTDKHGTAESITSAATSAVNNVDDVATGTLTIAGTAAEGGVLTANLASLVDADGAPTVTYQWQEKVSGNWVDLSGLTTTQLSIPSDQSHVGKVVRITATTTDPLGGHTSFTSAESTIANVNDAPTGGVSIAGTLERGQTLTASNTLADADGLGTVSYQWYAGSNPISGAISSTLVLTDSLVGQTIQVKASYTDVLGAAEHVLSAQSTAVTAPSTLTAVANGNNLTATSGADIYVIDASQTMSATISGFKAGDSLQISNRTSAQGISLTQDDWTDGIVKLTIGTAVITLTGLTAEKSVDNVTWLYDEASFTTLFGSNALVYGAQNNAPIFTSAATSADGTQVVLSFSEALLDTTATTDAYAVMVGGSAATVSAASVIGSTVVLTLASPVLSGQSVTVAYTDPSANNDDNAVQDILGNDAVSLAATSVSNNSTVSPVTVVAAPTTFSVQNGASTYTATSGADVFVIDATSNMSATINGFASGDTIEIVNGSTYQSFNVVIGQGGTPTQLAIGTATINLENSAPILQASEAGFIATFGANSVKYDLNEVEAITLYQINQLRHAPTTWATMLGVTLDKDFLGNAVTFDVAAKDSLVANQSLFDAALGHSQWMLANEVFDHYQGTDTTAANYKPSSRETASGYVPQASGENISMGYSTGSPYASAYALATEAVTGLFIDNNISGAGHRKNLLSANFADVGLGYALDNDVSGGYGYYGTQDFGRNASENPHLTGFVLSNTDGNFQFNNGEGLSGVTLTITDVTDNKQYSTLTQAYGYWDFEAIGGHTYNVTASGGTFSGTGAVSGVVLDTAITNGYNSRSVDFFSGTSWGRVDYGVATNHAGTGTLGITGTTKVGNVLTANASAIADVDGLGDFSYQWCVDGVAIQGKTASTLTLDNALAMYTHLALSGSGSSGDLASTWVAGHTFSVTATYTDQKGVLESFASASTAVIAA